MLHVPCVQGQGFWQHLRYGIVTATKVKNIITPAKLDPVKGEKRDRFMHRLLAEMILRRPLDEATTPAMIHGTDTESKARAAYALEMDIDPEPCGFCVNDGRTAGASPDNFVGEDGLAEFKAPFEPDIHLGYLLDEQSLVDEYRLQVQAQMWVTGRKWTDLVSYSLAIPHLVRVRISADSAAHTKMQEAVLKFNTDLAALTERAVSYGWLEVESWDQRLARLTASAPAPAGDFDLSDEDVRRIWEKTQSAV